MCVQLLEQTFVLPGSESNASQEIALPSRVALQVTGKHVQPQREWQHLPAASKRSSLVHATMRPLPPASGGGAQTKSPDRAEEQGPLCVLPSQMLSYMMLCVLR